MPRPFVLVDRWGVRDTVLYSTGKVSQIKDHLNNTITFGYGANGLSTITDPFSRVTTVTVQANKTLTTIQDPGGGSTQFTYDASLRLRRITNRKGDTSSFAYDSQSGKVVADTAPAVPVFGQGTVSPVTLFVPWQKGGVAYVANRPGIAEGSFRECPWAPGSAPSV